jgi:hypothetical protein
MVMKKVETTEEGKEEKKKEVIQVVDKLPVQEVRRIEREDVIINLITTEEALTSIMNGVK